MTDHALWCCGQVATVDPGSDPGGSGGMACREIVRGVPRM